MESLVDFDGDGSTTAVLSRELVNSNDLASLIERGNQLAESEDTVSDARQLFRRATELAPASGEAWFGLATSTSQLGNWTEAVNAAFMAGSFGFRQQDAWVLRAYCQEQLGRYEAAAENYLCGLHGDELSPKYLAMGNRGLMRLSEMDEVKMRRPASYHKALRTIRLQFGPADGPVSECTVRLFASNDARTKYMVLVHSDSEAIGRPPIDSIELVASAAARELHVAPGVTEFHVLVEHADTDPKLHRVRFGTMRQGTYESPETEDVCVSLFERRTGCPIDWQLIARDYVAIRP